MRIKSLFLLLLVAFEMNAANIDVTTSDLSTKYADAQDGDVLVLSEGTYTGTLNFPSGKTITLKAADDANVQFGCTFSGNNNSLTDGGIVLDGLKINPSNNYFINLNNYGDITKIEVRNCEVSGIGRCFLRTSNEGKSINELLFANSIIHDCGANGWNFLYPKHTVRQLTVTNNTLYNYTGGESFFAPNSTNQSNVFTLIFCNNTIYRWSKGNGYALCKSEGKYSGESVYVFKDNIVYKGGTDNVTPKLIQATGGTLTAQNNLVVDYGTYDMSNPVSSTISDLTLAGLGMAELSFPNPDGGDFTIVSTSPMATASTTGGIIGDPRWLKAVTQAVTLTVVASPAAGGVVTPANAVFNAGDEATVTATPNYGYRFGEWQDGSGNTLSTENPYTFAINADMQVTAVFNAIDTYTLTINKDGDGSKWGAVRLQPEPVNGVYETGTEVTVSVVPNSVTNFLYWENSSAELQRSVTMDGNKELTATFDVVPFIVAWDFAQSEPRGNRVADYAFTTDNTGSLNIYNGDGSSTQWGGSTRTFGGKERNCIRRYTDYVNMNNPRSYVARFNASGYTNVRIHSLAAADNDCVHSVQKLQWSADGENYTDLATLNMTKNEWLTFDAVLPENQTNVYIRWIGDTSSPLLGEVTSGTEGFYLADIVIYADQQSGEDHDAPLLLSSSPAEGSTSASARGNVVLSFNERVKAGEGSITLNGQALTPVYGNKTVTLAYKGLSYNTAYTLHIPAGSIKDMSDNAFAGADITFTTMNRPQPTKRVYDAVVAKDGTGDYTTVQAAIDAAPENRIAPWLIFVKNGEYEELVVIPKNKPFIHLIGQDREKTIISYWINNGGSNDIGWEYSTNNPASQTYGKQSVVQVNPTDFYTENISFIDSYGVKMQAGPMGLAMSSRADRQAFNNCSFRSFQDTWYTDVPNATDRQYVNNCLIEGAVDFYYGGGNNYVENSTFRMAREGTVIVAPSHRDGTEWGYVMVNNTIDGCGGANKLGRAWQNKPLTVWINTTLKTTIAPEGWSEWHIAPKLFAEYNTMDVNGDPVDLNNRRTTYTVDPDKLEPGESNPVTRKALLTADEAAVYTYEAVTAGDDDWNPRKFFEPVDAPAELAFAGNTLSWQASNYAICYVVIDDAEKVVGFTTECTFDVDGASSAYSVKAVNEYGSLSAATTVNTGTARNVTISEVGYATFYNDYSVTIPAALKAYWGEMVNENTKVRLTEITDGVIPAATAVVLKGDAGNYVLHATGTTGSEYNSNVLRGVTTDTPVSSLSLGDGQIYVLGKTTENKAAFCKFTGETLGNHRAFIFMPNASSHELAICFNDDTTGIGLSSSKTTSNWHYFNLNGQRVAHPTKGLYIVNGKKLIIK